VPLFVHGKVVAAFFGSSLGANFQQDYDVFVFLIKSGTCLADWLLN
jgi:hypothetical protein